MIYFHSENEFTITNYIPLAAWLSKCITSLKRTEGEISYIFCDDDYLLKLNREYLNHDTFTDIISFDYSNNSIISGDIFISTERVQENANSFNTFFADELHRVLIHGILHFVGYNDKTDAEKIEMRKQEDYYLSLRTF